MLYAQGFGYCKKTYTFQQSHLDRELLNFTPFDIVNDFKKLNKNDALEEQKMKSLYMAIRKYEA